MKINLRTRLTTTFIGLAMLPLLLVGAWVGWQSYTSQQKQALNLQQQVAQRVGSEVNAFIRERENELRLLTEVRGLQRLDQADQASLLSGLLSAQDVYEELTLLDNQGQEILRFSSSAIISADELENRAGAAEFEQPKASGETYFSSVQLDEVTNEPFMTIAIPLIDLRSGELSNVLVANFRFKTVWDLMVKAQVGYSGIVYVVSEPDNIVVAHTNPSVVLQETRFSPPEEDGFYPGLANTNAILAINHIKLGEQEFDVVAETSESEALALAINTLYASVAAIIVAVLVAAGLSVLVARQIVRPIEDMATSARSISAGNLVERIEVSNRDEIGELAEAFNHMTTQQRVLIDSLEQRVADRTHRLEVAASVSEQLNAILDLDQLLMEVVNQIQANFNYYHAHIYLLDEAGENLVMAAGTGEAGAEMKRQGRAILLDAPTSLVARAARQGEVVSVANVREVEDWLPNPLLPDTASEMAVPIILEGQVVGVLDIQEDRVTGLDEGDAGLLRTLANQVAVAIRNARLFAQTEAARAEAEAAQARYVGQAWGGAQRDKQRGYYYRQGASEPSQDEIDQLLELAQEKEQVDIAYPDKPVVVAPIRLQNQVIGAMEFLETDPSQQRTYTEQELALVQAIADQVAQSAENLRLFGETRERAGREQTIREITEKMQAAADMEALVKMTTEALGTYFSVDYATIELGFEKDEG